MTDTTAPLSPEPGTSTTAERLAARGPIAVTSRQATLAVMSAEPFDVCVIGGGIVGAGITREAALAGYRVALVERNDFAFGTSSRSSRLIHGGVRYLEHGHLGLVFESSRERRLLMELAPHLVRPLAFTWPVYRGARVPRWKVRAGLLLYDALSLFRNVHRHEGLSADGVLQYEPALAHEGLRGGARYWDAATDDTRLTLATVVAARDHGAMVANHLDVTGAVRSQNGTLTGVKVRDRITNAEFSIAARIIVNATGPWSDDTAGVMGERMDRAQVFGSVGAHVAVSRHRMGNRDALTIVSPLDGRVMFVLPAGPHAIIGTTERPARSGPDDVRATEQEVLYLLRSVNMCFPHANLVMNDVVSAWAGIRPLAAKRAGESSANAASREHAISVRDDGLISVTGGKLTTYRAMAADVLSRALQLAQQRDIHVTPERDARDSATTHLPGGDFADLSHLVRDATDTVHDPAVGERLAYAYGSNWRNVWSYAQRDRSLARRMVDDLPYLLAEIPHAVEREMACTIGDVLIRRTHVAFETRDNGRGVARRIAPLLGALLGWTDEQRTKEIENYDRSVSAIFALEL